MKKETAFEGQMSIFDYLKSKENIADSMSSNEIDQMINKLTAAKIQAVKREKREYKEELRRKALEEIRKEDEHIKEVTSMDLPLDWNNVFDSDERTQGIHADSVSDALVMSLTTLGKVDIEYISSISGTDYKEAIRALKGSIYQNPDTWNECFYKGWETSEEYLSGNLMRKWNAATKANEKYRGYFSENIAAIEKVLPPTVATKDIYVTLGSPWIPADVIDDFIVHLFGKCKNNYYYWASKKCKNEEMPEDFRTRHDVITGTWEIPEKSRYAHSIAVCHKYGTKRMEALHIIEKTLNMKSIAVMDDVVCQTTKSGKKKVINRQETLAALEKQQYIIKDFQKWIWADKARKERLEIIFENNYGCVRRRIFDGSFLKFPTMSSNVELYPYQKDAVARILFSSNTLLAHDVGSGKTYVMIAAGQELRRMGLSKKNMYVVPNNIVTQWRDIFLTMYPGSKLLCVEPKIFKPEKREEILKRIITDDFDGIIIAYSCFEMIPLSKEYYREALKDLKKRIEEEIKKTISTSSLKKKLDRTEKELSEASIDLAVSDIGICFDELGITRLFVDEAHNFKNVPIETKITSVLGINSNGSKKCQDMMDKVHMIQRKNDGKGVVMATGTPITNSITDAYIMQQYLQSGELGMLELQSFDAWVGMFAERRTEFEIDVDTNTYRLATRFTKFHNLPELTALLSSIADFHSADEVDGVPFHDGYKDAVISKSWEFGQFLKTISQRAEEIRKGYVDRRSDNMLKITSDGRKAALDMRLVDPVLSFSQISKISRCVENVADIYYRTTKDLSTQLIFCDISTPKAGFNVYSDLKSHLTEEGIPEETIAFIHDAATEKARSKLFESVRTGKIRILIGSTFKLGMGVNVQDRLIAIHHIDVPWRPADMTQREGRILRQGNMNKQVYIYRYITEGSFDAYSWQLLETKQRFISELLSGSLTDRSGSDIEDTVLDYAEVKALAIGNHLIKERVEAANELTRYLSLQKRTVEMRMVMGKELQDIPGKIEYQNTLIKTCEQDAERYKTWKEKHPTPGTAIAKKAEVETRKTLRENLYKAVHDYVLQPIEKSFMDYKGFDIVLPANMTLLKPYVWVVGTGKYSVELGDTEIGNLKRIDNCLDSLDERLTRLKTVKERFENRKAEIEAELSRDEDYSDLIEKFRDRVAEIDLALGVEKDE